MNNDIVDILLNKYSENKLSHIYLVESNNVDNTIRKITKFVKSVACPNKYYDNCNKCNICQNLDSGSNPNFIVIENESQTIKKEQLLDLQVKFESKPTFLKYNIYIVKNAEKMTESAQNTILKFLEEPQDDILGFLIVDQKEKLLETIVSRCQTIKEFYSEDLLTSEEIINLASKYYNGLSNSDKKLMLINKESSLILKSKDDLASFLKQLIKYYKEEQNNKQIVLLKKYINDIEYNINVELFLDKLVLEMSDIDE